MDIESYFSRIGYQGPRAPTQKVLRDILQTHVAAVPFENLDVQLGRPVANDPLSIFDKLVTRRRGGWCYEQNGLLGWVLETMGFDVTPVAGGVMRKVGGDDMVGDHLALIVTLGDRWLVDAGFGGSLSRPMPLRETRFQDGPFAVSLTSVDDGWWRFEEAVAGSSFSFDFRDTPADQTLLDHHQQRLQRDKTSPFVLNLVAQRRRGASHLSLRGRVVTEHTLAGTTKRTVASAEELADFLETAFGLDVPEITTRWPAICARHEAIFGKTA